MGVDLYAGPLARYCMMDWETPAARFAREHGLPFETVYQTLPRRFSRTEATDFSDEFHRRLADKLGEMPVWQMDPAAGYDVWQLTHQGLDAAVLVAAHRHRPELALPVQLPEDVQAHPAVAEASKQQYYIGPMASLEAHIIVPGTEARICGDENHRGQPVIIVTTAALVDAIEAVGEFLGLSDEALDRVLAEGPPVVNPVTRIAEGRRWAETREALPENPVRAHAAWGLACFRAALRFSRATGAVIIRDE